MKKALIGGVVGCLVLFVWGFVAHMMTPLGMAGWSTISAQEPVRTALKEMIPEPGLYMFPGHPPGVELTAEQQEAHMEDYRKGPSGILVWHPDGADAMSGKQLGLQFATNLVATLIAACLLTMTSAGFVGRFAFVSLLGLVPVFTVQVPEWNWYGYPQEYFTAQVAMQAIGWALVAVALAAIVKPEKKGG